MIVSIAGLAAFCRLRIGQFTRPGWGMQSLASSASPAFPASPSFPSFPAIMSLEHPRGLVSLPYGTMDLSLAELWSSGRWKLFLDALYVRRRPAGVSFSPHGLKPTRTSAARPAESRGRVQPLGIPSYCLEDPGRHSICCSSFSVLSARPRLIIYQGGRG